MGRRVGFALAALLVVSDVAMPARASAGGFARILRVPAQYRTVQAAVDASRPGDLILVAEGIYPGQVRVPEAKHDLTIRGESRDGVVFAGADRRANAIEVEADRVTLENLSAHDFAANGFYWDSVDGFAGRFLTVWNVQLYGIYAVQSSHGVIEQSYVSGAADAAFYIGECQPCDTVIRGVTARLSAVGYSGTNAGGNMVVRDSIWDRNGVGILPNSYDTGQEPPPQRSATFLRNVVRGSGTVATPTHTPLAGFAGIGIGVAGGNGNRIRSNVVTGSAAYGIAVFGTIQEPHEWNPRGNLVTGNQVTGSGRADLALATQAGPANCFHGNRFETSLPAGTPGDACSGDTGSSGNSGVADDLVAAIPTLLERFYAHRSPPPYSTMPKPAPQPDMPNATPTRPQVVWLTVLAAGGAAVVVAALVVLRRREMPAVRATVAAGGVAMVIGVLGLLVTRQNVRLASFPLPLTSPGGTPTPQVAAPPDPMDVGGRVAYSVPGERDGRVLVGTIGAPASPPDLEVAAVPGGVPAAIRWSPEGTRVAFAVRFVDRLASDVYVADAAGSEPPVLVTGSHTLGQCGSPSWSPDGSQLLFACARAMINPDQYRDPPGLYVSNADGSDAHRVGSGWADSPSWSPDGSRIAFESRRDGNDDIYVMDADGSNVRRLTTAPQADRHPTWSPDGSQIAFDSTGDGATIHIAVMDADGSNVRLLAEESSERDTAPRWPAPGMVAFLYTRTPGGIGIGLVRSTGSGIFRLGGPYEAFDWTGQ